MPTQSETPSVPTPGPVRSVLAIARFLSKDPGWILLLILLNLVFFSDVLFTDRTFYFRDVSFFHYPLKKLVTEAYSNGEWPLWNPYMQLGQPLLANPNSMALYPSQLLFHILPFDFAFKLHFILHCILAGIASFILGRELGFKRHSAFLAALIYNFSGVTLSYVNLFNILPMVVFLPLLTLLVIKIIRRPSRWAMAGGSLLFGCFFLFLEPMTSLAVALFLVPVSFSACASNLHTWKQWARAILLILIIVVGGLLLAAAQILPTLELFQNSGRKGGLDYTLVTGWSLHPINLIQLIFPRVFGEYFSFSKMHSWASPFFENREPYLLSCYIGVVPMLLACLGIFHGKRKIAWVLVGVSLLSVMLALGKYGSLYYWLFQHFAPFRYGRYPVKYLLTLNLSLCLLAGLGLERLEEIRSVAAKSRLSLNFFRTALLLVLVLLSAATLLTVTPSWSLLGLGKMNSGALEITWGARNLAISTSLIVESLHHFQFHLVVFLLLLLLSATHHVSIRIMVLSALLLVGFSLITQNFWINPLVRSDLYETAPAAKFLQQGMKEEGLFRIHGLSNDNSPEQPFVLGQSDSIVWSYYFRKLTLSHFLATKDHLQYAVVNPIDRLETVTSQLINSELAETKGLQEKLSFLAGMNVKYLFSSDEIVSSRISLEKTFKVNSDKPLHIYRLLDSLPRAFLIEEEEDRKGSGLYRDFLSVDSEASARVQSDTSKVRSGLESLGRITPVRLLKYNPGLVAIEANAPRASLLVLLDAYYPGWHARIDNQKAPVLCANYVFRGVRLSQGFHRVEFSYWPKSLTYGLMITCMTGMGWLLFCFVPVLSPVITGELFRQEDA